MRPRSPSVLVLHGDAAFLGRLAQAVPAGMERVDVSGWEALRACALRSAPTSLLVVDPYFGTSRRGPAPELGRLLREVRFAPVLAVAAFEPAQFDDARTLGAWGVAELATTGRDDAPPRLASALLALRAGYVARLLDVIVPPELPLRTRMLVAEALEIASRAEGAEAWAGTLGVSQRTLWAACQRTGLPTPRRLLAWMRVLLAAELLESPAHSIQSAARACGYASYTPLQRSARQLAGMGAAELRGPDGLGRAAERFHQELTRTRSGGGDA